MATSKLAIVNRCVATMGELPVDSIGSLYGYGAVALAYIEEQLTTLLQRGWWFNKDYAVELLPTVGTGDVTLPGDCLSVTPQDPRYVPRGTRLWDTTDHTFAIGKKVVADVTRRLSFDDLPGTAQDYISALVVQTFQINYDASSSKLQQADRDVKVAYVAFNSEHIKASRCNMLESGAVGRLRARQRYGLQGVFNG